MNGFVAVSKTDDSMVPYAGLLRKAIALSNGHKWQKLRLVHAFLNYCFEIKLISSVYSLFSHRKSYNLNYT